MPELVVSSVFLLAEVKACAALLGCAILTSPAIDKVDNEYHYLVRSTFWIFEHDFYL